jgi:hypothetical protein
MTQNLSINELRYGSVSVYIQELMQASQTHIKTLSQKEQDIIESYRNDWDADDWGNAKNSGNPPLLGYQLIKWVGAKINGNHNRSIGIEVPPLSLPELLENLNQSHITPDDIKEQIKNTKILNTVLHGFPVTNNNVIVYRGVPSRSYYGNKALHMRPGDIITIKTFCSTSINPTVAHRFTNINQTNACIWNIIIPSGKIFPYVSEDIPNEIIKNRLTGEQEILLPLCSKLRLLRILDTRPRILVFELIGFSDASEVSEILEEAEAKLIEVVTPRRGKKQKIQQSKKGGVRKNRKTKRRQTNSHT